MNWTRKDLKDRAKQVLKQTYLIAFVFGIIMVIAGGIGGSGSGGNGRNNYKNEYYNDYNGYTTNYSGNFSQARNYTGQLTKNYVESNPIVRFLPVFLPLYLMVIVFAVAFIIFKTLIGYALQIGVRRYYLDTAQSIPSGFYRITYGFAHYKNVFITMLIMSIKIFLWSLLLVIPGIIKAYEYRMVPHILADNPEMDWKRAMELSSAMTMGNKMDIFVLDLSFIGWRLLALVTFGISNYFVNPYVLATESQLYVQLRANAIGAGMTNAEELTIASAVYNA